MIRLPNKPTVYYMCNIYLRLKVSVCEAHLVKGNNSEKLHIS